MTGTVPQSVAEAGEALDIAIAHENAAAKAVAVLAPSAEVAPGFEIVVGAVHWQSPKRRRFHKVVKALELAKAGRAAALETYRGAVFAMAKVQDDQKKALYAARRQAGETAGQGQ